MTISIVLYAPDIAVFLRTLHSVAHAVNFAKRRASLSRVNLLIVDNGPANLAIRRQLQPVIAAKEFNRSFDLIELLDGHGNIGYGQGHNLARANSAQSDLQLILNPDVLLAEDSLHHAARFMALQPQAGVLVPAVSDERGQRQYLCKRYPSVLNFLLRGFAPRWLKKLFAERLSRYEMRDLIKDKVVWDVPIASGCFMLFRRSVLDQVHGFSPAFFLYFEDFDLSLRVAKASRIVYVPSVRIVHFGGEAAKKGWQHIGFFIRSGYVFYRQHGWKWF